MLKISSLTVAYGEHIALDKISMQVEAGEIVAVIGPNGAGKSTLIKAISGVLPLRNGQVTLAGRPIANLTGQDRARLTAVVPQSGYLPRAFSVQQTVMLGRTPYLGWLGRPRDVDLEAVENALSETDLTALKARSNYELSGGEQQRVLLARALAQETPILLLDEPTTHLDIRHQASILKRVQKLAHKNNKAVLIVLHDLNHAARFADRIVLLVAGKLRVDGAPSDVITEAVLRDVYGDDLRVTHHPGNGTPVILLD